MDTLARLSIALASLAMPVYAHADKPAPSVTIGVSLPLTGPRSEFANIVREGIIAALEPREDRARGSGSRFSVRVLDDKGEPELFRSNMALLEADSSVVAISMCWSQATCAIAENTAETGGVSLVGGLSGARLDGPRRSVSLLRASYGEEIRAIRQHASSLGIDRLVLLSDFVDAAALAEVSTQASSAGIVIALRGSGQLLSESLTDRVNEAFVVATNTADGVGVISAIRRARPLAHIYCLSTVDALGLARRMRSAAAGVAIAVHTPNPEVPSSVLVRTFQQSLERSGSVNMLTHEQLEAYIAVRVIQELAPPRAGVSRAALRAALQDTRVLTVSGHRVHLHPQVNQARTNLTLTVISKEGLLIQ